MRNAIIFLTLGFLWSPTLAIAISLKAVDWWLVKAIFTQQQTIVNTFIVSGGSATIALFLGAFNGFLLFRCRTPYKTVFLWITIIAISIPMHIQASSWLALLGRSGVFTTIAKEIFPTFSLYNAWGCAWIMGIYYTPMALLLSGFAFGQINQALEEESSTYLSLRRVLWYVTLPQVLSRLGFIWLGLFLLSLGEITVTDLLAISTIGEKIYLSFTIYYKPELALFGLVIITMIIAVVFIRKKGVMLLQSMGTRRFYFPYQRKYLSFLLITSGLFLLPIFTMIYITGSFSKWLSVCRLVLREYGFSMYIGSLQALSIAFISPMLAWGILRISSVKNWFVFALLWLALLPTPVLGIAMVRLGNFFTSLPLVGPYFFMVFDSPGILIFGAIFRFLPLGVLIVVIEMKTMAKKFEEMALLEGYNLWQQFFYIVIPLHFKSICLVFLIGLIFSLGEVGTSILIIPPGPTTLSIRMFTLLHYGVRSDVSACALLLLLTIAILVGAMMFLWKIPRKKN